jgi:VWFA-related protein
MIRPLRLIRGLVWFSAVALLGLPVALAQAPQSSSSQPAQSSSTPAKDNSDFDFDVTPGQAQAAGGGNTVLHTGSTLVLVPALVKTKKGDPVFTLTADNFVVTDDGIEQKARLEEDSGSQPLALVIVVETGGDGARYLDDYRDLGTLLESMVGNVRHRVAVVSFDSEPELVQNFNHDFDLVETTLNQLEPGDNGDAMLDALGYAVDMLRKQPPNYRRAILLLSETVDHGSHIKIEDALRVLSDTNTSIFSIAFSSSKTEIKHETASIASDPNPGPAGGCMATDPDKEPQPGDTKVKQAWNCAGVLLPPLRLANLAVRVGMNGLRKNVPETVAKLSGGEYFPFKDTRGLDRSLVELSNHIPNRYVLSFEPQSPHPGLHALGLRLKDDPGYVVTSRSSYWAQDSGSMVTSR